MTPPMVQVGWRSKVTGEMCECSPADISPHRHSDPVLVPADVAERMGISLHLRWRDRA